jgi:uncharacterized protein (DUF302 family)
MRVGYHPAKSDHGAPRPAESVQNVDMQAGSYGLGVTVAGPFESAVERVKEVFKEHGFGTLTQIDVQATLKEKLGADIEPYTILGVCNPGLAVRAIEAEHEVGLLLPCTILVHECAGSVKVSVQDPDLIVSITGNSELGSVASEAKAGIQNALNALS